MKEEGSKQVGNKSMKNTIFSFNENEVKPHKTELEIHNFYSVTWKKKNTL